MIKNEALVLSTPDGLEFRTQVDALYQSYQQDHTESGGSPFQLSLEYNYLDSVNPIFFCTIDSSIHISYTPHLSFAPWSFWLEYEHIGRGGKTLEEAQDNYYKDLNERNNKTSKSSRNILS